MLLFIVHEFLIGYDRYGPPAPPPMYDRGYNRFNGRDPVRLYSVFTVFFSVIVFSRAIAFVFTHAQLLCNQHKFRVISLLLQFDFRFRFRR